MNEIEDLRQLLQRRLLARPWPLAAGDAALLQRLATARQALAPPRGRQALPRIAQGVMALRLQRGATPYPELKYACYGIARPTDWEGRLLVDDERLCSELLTAVAALRPRRPKAYAACRRALQLAWDTDLAREDADLGTAAKRNRDKIAAFLAVNPPAG